MLDSSCREENFIELIIYVNELTDEYIQFKSLLLDHLPKSLIKEIKTFCANHTEMIGSVIKRLIAFVKNYPNITDSVSLPISLLKLELEAANNGPINLFVDNIHRLQFESILIGLLDNCYLTPFFENFEKLGSETSLNDIFDKTHDMFTRIYFFTGNDVVAMETAKIILNKLLNFFEKYHQNVFISEHPDQFYINYQLFISYIETLPVNIKTACIYQVFKHKWNILVFFHFRRKSIRTEFSQIPFDLNKTALNNYNESAFFKIFQLIQLCFDTNQNYFLSDLTGKYFNIILNLDVNMKNNILVNINEIVLSTVTADSNEIEDARNNLLLFIQLYQQMHMYTKDINDFLHGQLFNYIPRDLIPLFKTVVHEIQLSNVSFMESINEHFIKVLHHHANVHSLSTIVDESFFSRFPPETTQNVYFKCDPDKLKSIVSNTSNLSETDMIDIIFKEISILKP